jgi:hypothetical protein
MSCFLTFLILKEAWGALVRGKDGVIPEFEEQLDKYIGDLDIAMQNLQSSIQLHQCTIDLSAYQTHDDFANAVHHPEIITSLECTSFTCTCTSLAVLILSFDFHFMRFYEYLLFLFNEIDFIGLCSIHLQSLRLSFVFLSINRFYSLSFIQSTALLMI